MAPNQLDRKHTVRWVSIGTVAGRHRRIGRSPAAAVVDPVSNWNSVAVQATLTAGQNAIVPSRTLAIAQVAVHDALNAIDARYERYAFTGNAQVGASVDAAIAAAARDALVGAIAVGALPFPGFGTPATQALAVAQVDAAYAAALAVIPDGPPKSDGIAIGQAAAAAILALQKHRPCHHAGDLHSGHRARRLAADAEPCSLRSAGGRRPPACRASRLGTGHSIRAAAKRPIRAGRTASPVREALRA